MQLLTASWVVPGRGPPVAGGGILFSHGKIVEIGKARDLAARLPRARQTHYPGCALVSALVNGHAHLELSRFAPPVGPPDFISWILGVVSAKRAAPPGIAEAGIAAGAAACVCTGQGLVADVVGAALQAGAYPHDGPDVGAFPELIAAQPALAGPVLERALATFPAVPPAAPWGLSPHAPYTVCADAYRLSDGAARARGLALMTHVAESREEIEFCLCGSGPVVDRLYPELGAAPPEVPGRHPVEWLDRLALLGPRTILVHCVHIQPDHVGLLRQRGCGVVLCPRSNRVLSGGVAPGRALLDAGVPVALGTDSALSVGNLDLWEDVRCATEDFGWSPEEALHVATAGGARVLGVAAARGCFAPGMRADILAVPVTGEGSIWERLLQAPGPLAVWLAGSLRSPREEPGPDPTSPTSE